jgi:hypothetical protein
MRNFARKGNSMKVTLAILARAGLAIPAFAQGALAKSPDCRAIESTTARLACYDAASPPKFEKPVTAESDVARAAYKDPFAEDDARTTAKLKNICRGC